MLRCWCENAHTMPEVKIQTPAVSCTLKIDKLPHNRCSFLCRHSYVVILTICQDKRRSISSVSHQYQQDIDQIISGVDFCIDESAE